MATDIAQRKTTKGTTTTMTQFHAGKGNLSIQLTQKSIGGLFNNLQLNADDARWLAAQLNDWATKADRGNV